MLAENLQTRSKKAVQSMVACLMAENWFGLLPYRGSVHPSKRDKNWRIVVCYLRCREWRNV